jgi:hypothetical protein
LDEPAVGDLGLGGEFLVELVLLPGGEDADPLSTSAWLGALTLSESHTLR